MINVIGITNENGLEQHSSLANVDITKYKWVWVDFKEPTNEEINLLSTFFHFHSLAIEDCTQQLQRPKLNYFEDHTFFVTHIVHEEKNEIIKDELDFFIGDIFIVTFHQRPLQEINFVWDLLLSHNEIGRWDTYYVFYQILDKIVDNYFPPIYKIEDDLDKMEDNSERKSMNDLMNELFEARKMLLHLLHSINPMRDLLYRMLNSHHLSGVAERKEYFTDIYDHLLKLSEMIMSNREVTADIRDSYLSLNSHQTNNVMKVLTIITSIFAPLTLLAGIYGMNFENMPELTWKYGYILSLGTMILIAIFMYLWFKRKGWFR